MTSQGKCFPRSLFSCGSSNRSNKKIVQGSLLPMGIVEDKICRRSSSPIGWRKWLFQIMPIRSFAGEAFFSPLDGSNKNFPKEYYKPKKHWRKIATKEAFSSLEKSWIWLLFSQWTATRRTPTNEMEGWRDVPACRPVPPPPYSSPSLWPHTGSWSEQERSWLKDGLENRKNLFFLILTVFLAEPATGMLGYWTKILDARVPMPATSALMPGFYILDLHRFVAGPLYEVKEPFVICF